MVAKAVEEMEVVRVEAETETEVATAVVATAEDGGER